MVTLPEKLLATAIIDGHFTLASGRHANQKFDFDLIAADTPLLLTTAHHIANVIHQDFPTIKSIITVANGANVLADPVAMFLAEMKHEVQAIQSHKDIAGNFTVEEELKASYVIIDDVFTKGTNAKKLIDVLYHNHGLPQALFVVLNRHQNGQAALNYHDQGQLPVKSIVNYAMTDIDPNQCKCSSSR